jgi:hypothetical protein
MLKEGMIAKRNREDCNEEALEMAWLINEWVVERGRSWEKDERLVYLSALAWEDEAGAYGESLDDRISRMLQNPGAQSAELWSESMAELKEAKEEAAKELSTLRGYAAGDERRLVNLVRDIEKLKSVEEAVSGVSGEPSAVAGGSGAVARQ